MVAPAVPVSTPQSGDSRSNANVAHVAASAGTKITRASQAWDEAQKAVKATQVAKDSLTQAFETNGAASVKALLKSVGRDNPTTADMALARTAIDNAAMKTARHLVREVAPSATNTPLVTDNEVLFFEKELTQELKTSLADGKTSEELSTITRDLVEAATVSPAIRAALGTATGALHALAPGLSLVSFGADAAKWVSIYRDPASPTLQRVAISTAVGTDALATVGTGAAVAAGAGATVPEVLLTLAAPEVMIPLLLIGGIASIYAAMK